MTSSNSEIYEGLDYDSVLLKRRIQAVASSVADVKEHVRDICPDIPDIFSIEEDWAEVNTYPSPAYDYEERFTYSAVAAAIWMLDRIVDVGGKKKLMSLLQPSDERAGFFRPALWDPCHSLEVIESLLEAIYFRNESENYGDCAGQIQRVYMTETIARRQIDHSLPNRITFDTILDLIPRESIDKAVDHYTRVYWEWITRYYRSRRLLAECEDEISEEMEEYRQRVEQVKQELRNAIEKNGLQQPYLAPLANVNVPTPLELLEKRPTSEHIMGASVTASVRLEEEREALNQKRDEIIWGVGEFWQMSAYFTQMPHDSIADAFGEEIACIWDGFEIGDPYELCFAFLYLLDSGSDLPWCYYAGVNLHIAYAALLPWPRNRYNVAVDGVWIHTDPKTGESVPGPDPQPLPKRIRTPEPDNWLQLEFENKSEENEKFNLGQIIYEATGCIMPRNLDRHYPTLRTLDRYGIRGKQAIKPLLYCMTILGEVKHQTQPYYDSLRITPEERAQIDREEATVEEMLAQINALREENRKLKQQVYDNSREAKDERNRYEILAQKAANDAQELRDLRELVFNRRSEKTESDTAASVVSFPYITSQHIVVFGGHEGWVKEMKPKLPGVRFIDRDMVPNPDLIRRADTVWIQTNALSHAYYYKIIDETRKNNIRVRYFSYSSPQKCAAQIVEDEVK